MTLRSFVSCFAAVTAAGVLATALLAQSTGQSPGDAELARFPAGPGRDALLKVCGNCHTPDSALSQFKTREEWTKTLDEMANNGAQGSDEEWNEIQAYLDKHYTFIFVNKADAKDLESVLDVTPVVAEAIVRRRADTGNYRSIDDLKQVPGINAAAIDARKDRFVF